MISARSQGALMLTLCFSLFVFACKDITGPLLSPDTGIRRLINPSGIIVVTPDSMRGWSFRDDQRDLPCSNADVCHLVERPIGNLLGTGSAELATTASTDGNALILADYKGIRFDQLTALRYSTYRQSTDAGNNLAIALQFNADYDLSDVATGWQGRLVFEPYHGNGGNVTQGAWQQWDAKAGKWWGTVSGSPEHTQTLFDLGAKFICHGCDLIMVKQGMEQIQQR